MRRFVAPKHYSGRNSRRVKASKQWPSTRPSWMRCVKKPRACERCDWLATPQRGQRPVGRARRSLSIFRVSDNLLALANEVIELKENVQKGQQLVWHPKDKPNDPRFKSPIFPPTWTCSWGGPLLAVRSAIMWVRISAHMSLTTEAHSVVAIYNQPQMAATVIAAVLHDSLGRLWKAWCDPRWRYGESSTHARSPIQRAPCPNCNRLTNVDFLTLFLSARADR